MQINTSQIFDAVLLVTVLSFFIERALALIFEHAWYKRHLSKKSGIKEIIAFVSAFGICKFWSFDAYAMIFASEKVSQMGFVLTALVIAGGSKGSLALFRDVLQIGKEANRSKKEIINNN